MPQTGPEFDKNKLLQSGYRHTYDQFIQKITLMNYLCAVLPGTKNQQYSLLAATPSL